MEFSDRLIALRKASGLSQEELGYRLGVTRQTVSKWESGQTTPEMKKLVELSALFSVSMDDLAGNTRPKENAQTVPVPSRLFHYEYKSPTTLCGLPLVHINIGFGLYKAHGVLAIGTLAKGWVALGVVALGLLSLGALGVGVIALGGVGLGLLAFGGIAAGAAAFGGVAVGLLAVGGLAVGKYALGGFAAATDIARGGYAQAHIAIGDTVKGDFIWADSKRLTPADLAAIRETILREYPRIWRFLLRLFT